MMGLTKTWFQGITTCNLWID